MQDDLTTLEHRIDKLEAWHEAEEAIKKAKADELTRKHTSFQFTLSAIGTLTMLVNLYLTLIHLK